MKMSRSRWGIMAALLGLLLLIGCSTGTAPETAEVVRDLQVRILAVEQALEDMDQTSAEAPETEPAAPTSDVDVSYTLTTAADGGQLLFVGVGGDIDGEINPTLTAEPGQTVEITLINGHSVEHDLKIDEFDVETGSLTQEGEESTIVFTVLEDGVVSYYCTIPGHRAAGMEGSFVVGEPTQQAATGANIVKDPSDLPPPIGARGPETVKVDLVAQEIVGQLAEETTMTYFTFNGTVPGPFIRVRQGDEVEISVTNELDSTFIHSIDLHAVNGPGGGAVFTQTQPGETTVFTFTALTPGIFVYHCATPSIPHHISNGMYGLILVEPPGGLPPVDREFYVVQGEMYTVQPFGTPGHAEFSHEKMLNEDPEYFTFNGAAGALAADENALRAEVGDTVRIFMGVGGPNFTSSFHVIGEIFDEVYPFGSLTSPTLTDVQTISVAPGGAWAVEFKIDVPGTYILVDHALSRLERGLVGLLHAEGEDDPSIFREGPASP